MITPVDATIAGLAEPLGGITARTAVSHRNQQIDDELLEEGGVVLVDPFQEFGLQGRVDGLVCSLDDFLRRS